MTAATNTGRGFLVAITGGIGCGKSEVGRLLKARGVPVLDADDLAREALAPGTPGAREVARVFGPDVVGPGGAIDRAALARRVFAHAAERETLNGLVHPEVRRRWTAWCEEQRREGRLAGVIIPLLYEVGADQGWDLRVCVSAPEDIVLQRLAGRGMSPEEVAGRMAAQWPLEEKERRSDVTINNNRTLDDLERQVDGLLAWIGERRSSI